MKLELIKTVIDDNGKPTRFTRNYEIATLLLEPNDDDVCSLGDARNFTIIFDDPAKAKEFCEIERTFIGQHLEVEDNLSKENTWFVFNFRPDKQSMTVSPE